MAASSPATTSHSVASPAHPLHRPGIATCVSPAPSFCPHLATYYSCAVTSVSASAAPRPAPRGRGLRCRAVDERPTPSRREAPLKVMISGAPASGKGTQCLMIVEKYGLVHISTGDLLRAEVSSGTEIGKKAKEYMDNGKLVPDQVVTDMVVSRLSQPDVQQRWWLLDGYPRSFSQAQSFESMKIRPDIFIVLETADLRYPQANWFSQNNYGIKGVFGKRTRLVGVRGRAEPQILGPDTIVHMAWMPATLFNIDATIFQAASKGMSRISLGWAG